MGVYQIQGKGDYVFGSVGLSVFLSVCKQHYSNIYEWTAMKFYEGVGVIKGRND